MVQVKRFHADWCGPCKMLAPTMEKVKGQFPEVGFIDVDVDQNPEEAQANHVRNIPLVVIEKDGQIVDRIAGLNSEETYVQKLRQVV